MKYCPECLKENPNDSKFCEGCGQSINYDAPIYHLAVGTMLNGKYLVGKALGEGGFGITYIGKDIKLNLLVAIKEYYPNGYVNRSNTLSSSLTCSVDTERRLVYEKGLKRFLDEARALAKFAGTDGIVDVRDFFEENNTAYIVMEYLDGQTLKTFLEYNGILSDKDTVELLMPIMQALSKVHSSGLIHRDISPDNIMLMEGKVKLLDFGAVRDVTGAENKSMTVTLKHGYAPEEQYRGHGEQGPWTDIYALCATMYKCVTGKIPYDAMERMNKDEVLWPTEMGISIHSDFEKVLMKGLSVFAKDRYQNVGDLIDAIKATELYGVKNSTNIELNKHEDKKSPLKIILPVSIALAVVMVVVGIILTFKNNDNKPDNDHDNKQNISNEITEANNDKSVDTDVTANLKEDPNEIMITENTEDKKQADVETIPIISADESNTNEDYVEKDESKVERVSQIKDHTASYIKLENITIYEEDIKDLFNCHNMVFLSFENCYFNEGCLDILNEKTLKTAIINIKGCSGLDNLKWLSNKTTLTDLQIANCGLTDELFGQIDFSKLTLENLDISDNPNLSDISNLYSCTSLKILNMNNDRVSDLSFFTDIKNLTELSANNNFLRSLDGLETAIRLKNLYVAGNALTNIDGIKNCTLLEKVNLNDNYLTEIGNVAKSKDTLVKLFFNNNNVTSIKGLKNCDKLECLSLSNNQVTELKHLKNMKNLKTLNVSNNLVESLDSLSECSNLFCLCASGNNISVCKSLSVFDQTDKNKKSRYVDLSDNKLTEIGNLPSNRSCEVFAVYGNELTNYNFLDNVSIKNLLVDYKKALISKGKNLNCSSLYVLECPLDKEVKLKAAYLNAETFDKEQMKEKVMELIYSNRTSWFGEAGERKELPKTE